MKVTITHTSKRYFEIVIQSDVLDIEVGTAKIYTNGEVRITMKQSKFFSLQELLDFNVAVAMLAQNIASATTG
jgi:hypothetical protein